MARFLKNKGASLGQAPGELIFIGEKKVRKVTIRIIDYDHGNISEQELKDIRNSIYLTRTKRPSLG